MSRKHHTAALIDGRAGFGIRTAFNLGVGRSVTQPPALDGLSSAPLKGLVIQPLAELAEPSQAMAAQREEIARLKGLNGCPSRP